MFASFLGELVSIGLVFAAPARCASEYTLGKRLFPPSAADDENLFIVRSVLPTMHSVLVIPTGIGYSDRALRVGCAVPS